MEVVENPRKMSGKGAPKDTLFGVIGHTKMDPMTRSLGGLVIGTTKGESPAKAAHKAHAHPDTEKNLTDRNLRLTSQDNTTGKSYMPESL